MLLSLRLAPKATLFNPHQKRKAKAKYCWCSKTENTLLPSSQNLPKLNQILYRTLSPITPLINPVLAFLARCNFPSQRRETPTPGHRPLLNLCTCNINLPIPLTNVTIHYESSSAQWPTVKVPKLRLLMSSRQLLRRLNKLIAAK